MNKLTSEQKQIVENNHQLIYGYAALKKIDVDKYYDVLAIGLCKAAIHFNPNKGCVFSTYAYQKMHGEMSIDRRKIYNKKEISFANQGGELNELYDGLSHEEFNDKDLLVEDFLNTLFGLKRSVCVLGMEGYTLDEIAKKTGETKNRIAKEREKLKFAWKIYSAVK